MEVGQAHNGLYPSTPHIVSNNVAYTREGDSDPLAL
jgi:hypothetical protein